MGATAAVLAGAAALGALGEDARASALIAPPALAGIGSAMGFLLARAGRRGLGLAVACVANAVVAVFVVASASRPAAMRAPVLIEADREGLAEVEIDGARWVTHQTIGFRLPQPAIALSVDEELVRETVEAASREWIDAHQVWAFASEDGRTSVMIDLGRITRADDEALARLRLGVIEPLRAAGHELREGEVEGGAACRSVGLEAALTSGGRLDARLFVFEDPTSHRAFSLVITVVGPRESSWSDYLATVIVPCGGRVSPR